MKKIDYFAIMALGLLFTIILAGQFGIFSSNVKQEGLQGNLTEAVTIILTKINQSEILQHEDDERRKQNTINSIQRDNQTQLLLKEDKALFTNFLIQFKEYADKQNNTTHRILHDIGTAIDQNQNITNQNYKISKEHKQVAYDHDQIQNNVSNTTNKVDNQTLQIYNLLDYLGERNANLTKEGIEVQKDNNKMLKELKPKVNKIYEWIFE